MKVVFWWKCSTLCKEVWAITCVGMNVNVHYTGMHVIYRCVLCCFSYHISHCVHVLLVQIKCCKANHTKEGMKLFFVYVFCMMNHFWENQWLDFTLMKHRSYIELIWIKIKYTPNTFYCRNLIPYCIKN
jgi:hypothetical protein